MSAKDLEKIEYSRWDDMLTPEYNARVEFVKEQFSNDSTFKTKILSIVEFFIGDEKDRFSEEEKNKLVEYILEELPETLTKVPIQGKLYDAYAYPFDSLITELAENIQQGLAFPIIREKLVDNGIKVFLEVR